MALEELNTEDKHKTRQKAGIFFVVVGILGLLSIGGLFASEGLIAYPDHPKNLFKKVWTAIRILDNNQFEFNQTHNSFNERLAILEGTSSSIPPPSTESLAVEDGSIVYPTNLRDKRKFKKVWKAIRILDNHQIGFKQTHTSISDRILFLEAAFTPTETIPPVVTLNSPSNGETISGIMTLSATATDASGIDRVEFYLDNLITLLGTDSTGPSYTFDLLTSRYTDGNHRIIAAAIDNEGNVQPGIVNVVIDNSGGPVITEEGVIVYPNDPKRMFKKVWTAIRILDNNQIEFQQFHDRFNNRISFSERTSTFTPTETIPPLVTLINPSEGETISGITTLTATAADESGIDRVDFYLDNLVTPLGTDSTGPNYALSLLTSGYTDGAHIIIAVAIDNEGNAQTDIANVVIDNSGGPIVVAPTDMEDRCANPKAGEVCECSEPFNVDDGVIGDLARYLQELGNNRYFGIHNPSGSVTKECKDSGFVVGTGYGDYVTGASVGLPTTPWVLRNEDDNGNAHLKMTLDYGAVITDKSWCTRYYAYWDPEWECNEDQPAGQCGVGDSGPCGCNLKGPRFLSSDGNVYTPAAQSSTPHSRPGQPNPAIFPSTQQFSKGNIGGYCQFPACTGTGSFGSGLRRNQDPGLNGVDIYFEDLQNGWSRWEICIDHNPTVPYNTGAPFFGQYDGESPDRMFMRWRVTMINGPLEGDQMFWGPGMTGGSMDQANIGQGRIWNTGWGSDSEHDPSSAYLSTVIVMTKPQADPTWWIGPACEIEPNHPECIQ